jgi:hypothetical protein
VALVEGGQQVPAGVRVGELLLQRIGVQPQRLRDGREVLRRAVGGVGGVRAIGRLAVIAGDRQLPVDEVRRPLRDPRVRRRHRPSRPSGLEVGDDGAQEVVLRDALLLRQIGQRRAVLPRLHQVLRAHAQQLRSARQLQRRRLSPEQADLVGGLRGVDGDEAHVG